HYGVSVRADLLLEPRQWEMVRFGGAMFPTPYPYWIIPGYQSLDGESPVTASLQSLSFPWASSLAVDVSTQPGTRVDTLVRTSPEAWSEAGPQSLYPRELAEYEPGEAGEHPVAVLLTGPLSSRYASGPPLDSATGATPAEAAGLLR